MSSQYICLFVVVVVIILIVVELVTKSKIIKYSRQYTQK